MIKKPANPELLIVDDEKVIREMLGALLVREGYNVTTAENGDVVLIAGKGHEDYQVVGTQRVHFSDREVVQEYIHGR